MKKIRILLTGGGTGGHIYPLIAVAKKLKELSAKNNMEGYLRYFGPKNVFTFYLTGEDIPVSHIASSKIRRYFSILNFLDGSRFIWSVFQALFKVYWFMPDVAFSKGGPGAIAVLLACRFYRVPIIIHESDAVPGLTNKISAHWAEKVLLGFAGAQKYFGRLPSIIFETVGVPVAEELLVNVDKETARRAFGLDIAKPTILVLGGSQGSTRINDFIFANLERLLEKYQIIHSVGNENYDNYKKQTSNIQYPTSNYYFTAYLENNLREAYVAADVVISRAGAQTIFELAALVKPVILIPLPESANDHQRINAYEYSATGGAVVVEEENLLINIMEAKISEMIGRKIDSGFYIKNSAELIAGDILSVL